MFYQVSVFIPAVLELYPNGSRADIPSDLALQFAGPFGLTAGVSSGSLAQLKWSGLGAHKGEVALE